MNNHLEELVELREDVIEDLRGLIRKVDSIDYNSLKKIAYAIGTREKEEEDIEININFQPEHISQYLPDGTPYSVLLKCLQGIQQPLAERANYDATEMLIVLKDDMYETLTDYLVEQLKSQYGYSMFGEVNFVPDEEYVLAVTATDHENTIVNVLVKLETNQEYSVWRISERPKDDEELSEEVIESLLSNAVHVGNIRLSDDE